MTDWLSLGLACLLAAVAGIAFRRGWQAQQRSRKDRQTKEPPHKSQRRVNQGLRQAAERLPMHSAERLWVDAARHVLSGIADESVMVDGYFDDYDHLTDDSLRYQDVKAQCRIWMTQLEIDCEDDSEARDWLSNRFIDALEYVLVERKEATRQTNV